MRCLYSDVLLRCMLLVGVSFMTACNALFLTEDAARDAIGDLDGDGYSACSQSNPTNTCDCDDNNEEIHPNASESCDGIDSDCSDGDGIDADDEVDNDGDGARRCGENGDCNDNNNKIHPDADELCDGVDNDCDNLLDAADDSISDAQLYYRDEDQDGYGDENAPKLGCTAPGGYVENATDCDDKNDDIKPAADELCDEQDNNCDGNVDETPVDGIHFFLDADGDTYGDDTQDIWACNAPEDYVEDHTDCDDQNVEIHPKALESCDGIDSDCSDGDGDLDAVDEVDNDGDGSRPCGVDPDCNDKRNDIYPGAPERCDVDLDSNCDGLPRNLIVIVDETKCPGSDADNCRQKGEPLFQPNEVESPGFATIQSAMDASSDGKLILVQCGITYKENINFKGKKVILMSQQGQDTTVIDGNEVSSAVLFLNGETAATVLDGFTVQHGKAIVGGGIAVSRSNPTLRNLIVQDNEATSGGGIYMVVSDSSLTNVEVRKNTTIDAGGGISIQLNPIEGDGPLLENVYVHDNITANYGAGIQASQVNLTLKNVTITKNKKAILGGGLYLLYAKATSHNLKVEQNTVLPQPNADGVDVGYGGGIWAVGSTLSLDNTTVKGNTGALIGGGIYLSSSKISSNNLKVQGNQATTFGGGIWAEFSALNLRNLLVTENKSDTDGAGVSLHGVYPTRPGEDEPPPSEFIHTVIANNTALRWGGGFSLCEHRVRLSNSVVAYNQAAEAGNLHDYKEGGIECGVSTLTLEYVNLYNPDSFSKDVSTYEDTPEDTLYTYEPQFLQYKDDFPVDYHLALGGQLIDKGTSSLSGLTTELQPGLDPDGTKTDLGIYGGTYGSKWDLDLDSYPDYFWPGSYDAKADRSCYDPNDQDATTPTQPRSPTCSN